MTIQQLLAEGRLIRNEWSGTDNAGRQLLCLYTALIGDPSARPESCPMAVCPTWLAHLLPWMDDSGSADHWPTVVRRVAAVAPRLGTLSPRVGWLVRALIVREAMRYTRDAAALAVCNRVAALCEACAAGVAVDASQWAAAWAASDAASAAARAAERAARAAAWAASDRIIDGILDLIEADKEAQP